VNNITVGYYVVFQLVVFWYEMLSLSLVLACRKWNCISSELSSCREL